MKDMIPKGTGNSRFLRSVSNFKTIYPTYDDFVNALVAGNLPVDFNGINEAGIQQVGTPLNKANLLADETAALLGLGQNDPTVNDALNVLANIGNVHVWQRVQTYADPVPEVPAGYTLGEVEENVQLFNATSSKYDNRNCACEYADAVTVANDGTVSLGDASTGSLRASHPERVDDQTENNKIIGKFVRLTGGNYVNTFVDYLFYVPEDATVTAGPDSTTNYVVASKLQRVTGYPYTPAIPAGTHVDYLTSTDPNAYPDNVSDAQDAHYVLGPAVTGNFKLSANYNSSSIFHALSITVDDDGNVSLVNAVEVPASKYDDTLVNALKGRFVTADSTDIYSAFENGATIYIPNDASINRTSGLTISKYQPVTGYPAIPANTVITYLGQLGEPGAKIEVGSYVGTGTYGSGNPCSITASFPIKLVVVWGTIEIGRPSIYGGECFAHLDIMYSSVYADVLSESFAKYRGMCSVGDGTDYSYVKRSADGKTISWYNEASSNFQMNSAASYGDALTHYYIAIG